MTQLMINPKDAIVHVVYMNYEGEAPEIWGVYASEEGARDAKREATRMLLEDSHWYLCDGGMAEHESDRRHDLAYQDPEKALEDYYNTDPPSGRIYAEKHGGVWVDSVVVQ